MSEEAVKTRTYEDGLGKRIRKARTHQDPGKWSQGDLGGRMGVKDRTIRRWESGEFPEDAELLRKLADTLSVRYEWLRTGEGEMRSSSSDEVQRSGNGGPVDSEQTLPVFDIEARAGTGGTIVSEQPIGRITPAEDSPLYRIEGEDGRHAFYLPVHGTSMHPTLQDGEIVPVRRYEEPLRHITWDAVYVYRYEGSIFVKRLRKMGDGRIEVISDSERFPNDVISVDEGTDFHIIGKVLVD